MDPVKVAEQQETRDALDAALHELRREMLQVSSDCKGAEIKRLLLLQELQILQVRHLWGGLFYMQPAVGRPLEAGCMNCCGTTCRRPVLPQEQHCLKVGAANLLLVLSATC